MWASREGEAEGKRNTGSKQLQRSPCFVICTTAKVQNWNPRCSLEHGQAGLPRCKTALEHTAGVNIREKSIQQKVENNATRQEQGAHNPHVCRLYECDTSRTWGGRRFVSSHLDREEYQMDEGAVRLVSYILRQAGHWTGTSLPHAPRLLARRARYAQPTQMLDVVPLASSFLLRGVRGRLRLARSKGMEKWSSISPNLYPEGLLRGGVSFYVYVGGLTADRCVKRWPRAPHRQQSSVRASGRITALSMSGFTGKAGKAKGSAGGKGSKAKGVSNDGQAGKVRGGC